MLLTQLPLLCNKHRASIFKNTVKLCYNIPSPGSGQFSLFRAPPPRQHLLAAALQNVIDLLEKSHFFLKDISSQWLFFFCRTRARACVCVGRGGGRGEPDGCPRPSEPALRSAAPESWGAFCERRPAPHMSSRVPPARDSGAPGDPGRAGGSGARSGERARAVGVPGPHPARGLLCVGGPKQAGCF